MSAAIGIVILYCIYVTTNIAIEYTDFVSDQFSILSRPFDNPTEEIVKNQKDGDEINTWIRYCVTGNGKTNLRKEYAYILHTTEDNYSTDWDPPSNKNESRQLFQNELKLTRLSRNIVFDRSGLRIQSRASFFYWEIGTWISITLGMLTTILVSLSSTEFGRDAGNLQRLIRMLAIVFPALGTATAALIAFYSPQAQWNLSSRTLASLTQLQDQMATEVWKKDCINAPNDEEDAALGRSLDEWYKRYLDISAISTASGSSGPTNGTPGDGAKPDGTQQAPPISSQPPTTAAASH